ncbi:MAG: hypothetical protein IT392_04345 [Nitrospirae bacterium]|nr:hypothetical protein [Nitrospirota bacterium]
MTQYNIVLIRERQKKDRFRKAHVVTDNFVRILAGKYGVKKIALSGIITEKEWSFMNGDEYSEFVHRD